MFSKRSISAASLAMVVGASALVQPEAPVTSMAIAAPASSHAAASTLAPADRSSCSYGIDGSNTISVCTFWPDAAPTTIRLMAFPGNIAVGGYVASIMNADRCHTTYAVACTGGTCKAGNMADEIMVTQGPLDVEYQFRQTSNGFATYMAASCEMRGQKNIPTSMVCDETMSTSVSSSMRASQSRHFTLENLYTFVPLALTGGTSGLPKADKTCTKKLKHNAAAPTGIPEVYKVLVPVGAALVAGAGALL